jgi:uncharacterized protein
MPHDGTQNVQLCNACGGWRRKARRADAVKSRKIAMTEPATPRQVLERLLDGIANRRWAELHELYAEQAVIDYPFGLPAPRRLQGKDAIRSYFATVAQQPLLLRARDTIVHETADPEVVVAEWNYDGLVTSTGRTFEVANIQVSRVRDGRIVESRDYHNHIAIANAAGRLTDIVSALTATRGDRDAPRS